MTENAPTKNDAAVSNLGSFGSLNTMMQAIAIACAEPEVSGPMPLRLRLREIVSPERQARHTILSTKNLSDKRILEATDVR